MNWNYDTPFDEMFDFNRDGHLDRGEEACRNIYIMEQIEGDNNEDDDDLKLSKYDEDDSDCESDNPEFDGEYSFEREYGIDDEDDLRLI